MQGVSLHHHVSHFQFSILALWWVGLPSSPFSTMMMSINDWASMSITPNGSFEIGFSTISMVHLWTNPPCCTSCTISIQTTLSKNLHMFGTTCCNIQLLVMPDSLSLVCPCIILLWPLHNVEAGQIGIRVLLAGVLLPVAAMVNFNFEAGAWMSFYHSNILVALY